MTRQACPEVRVIAIDDPLPAKALSPGDVRWQVVDEEALGGSALRQALAVREEGRARLASPDLIRQDASIEMRQCWLEQALEVPGVEVVGIAGQQQAVARHQTRHQDRKSVV